MGKAVTLDTHWGKPDHLEIVLGTDPVLQGGNIICRKLADVRLTAQQEICSCKIPVNSWVLPHLNSLAAVLTTWLSILIPLKISCVSLMGGCYCPCWANPVFSSSLGNCTTGTAHLFFFHGFAGQQDFFPAHVHPPFSSQSWGQGELTE